MKKTVILGIESSCDETSAGIVRAGTELLAGYVHSQASIHAEYGGVVPELASRDHLARILPVIDTTLSAAGMTLSDIDCIAVTAGPGLIGALLVGVQCAKGLAASMGIPLIGVNHLEGHLYAVRLEPNPPEPPFVGMIVSGGHTSLFLVEDNPHRYTLLGKTLDDAAGEAFDKIARLLGFSYPGGRAIEELAVDGDPKALSFPRGMRGRGINFSFSGLKTSVRQYLDTHGILEEKDLADLCASVQEAIVDSLTEKALRAVRETGINKLVLSGGVAANGRLRQKMSEMASESGIVFFVPSMHLCTDNAAMIAAAGYAGFISGRRNGYDLEPDPGWRLE